MTVFLPEHTNVISLAAIIVLLFNFFSFPIYDLVGLPDPIYDKQVHHPTVMFSHSNVAQ